MNDADIEVLEKRLIAENLARDTAEKSYIERVWRLEKVSKYLDEPKGILAKRCPKCNSRLGTDASSCGTYLRWFCGCGYEYVRRVVGAYDGTF